MKRNLITTLIALFAGLFSLQAQIKSPLWYSTAKTFEFHIKTGFTTSIINSDLDGIGDPQIRVSFMGGIAERYNFTDRFFIQVGADLSPRGGGFSNAEQVRLTYLDIPTVVGYNIRYNLFKLPFQFDLYGGLQPSFLLNASIDDVDNPEDGFNRTGLDFVIGSGFPLWRFTFYATNKISITNISNGGNAFRNITTEWTLGYRFGGKNSGLSN